MMNLLWKRKGVTLLELIVAISILTILVAGIVPLTRLTAKRTREIELRRNLRIMRTAIDDFKKTYDKAVDEKKIPTTVNKSGCPETLLQLVEGFDFGGLYAYKKKFLRRIPVDPMNPPDPGEEPKWGLRSYSDQPDSTSWGGEDVYDVYSLSEGTAIDGTKYSDW
jgi:general secretion pathway protein G